MKPKAESWAPRCVTYEFDIFIKSGIYQTQGLFTICALDTDVTDDSHGDCSLTAGHPRKKTLNFNLVKVQLFTLIS